MHGGIDRIMKMETNNLNAVGFNKPELTVVLFENEDVITASTPINAIDYSQTDLNWDTPKVGK